MILRHFPSFLNKKWPIIVEFGWISLYLTVSLIYFKERCLYVDSAAEIWELSNEQSFSVPHYRYAGILTQILPYLGSMLQLPLGVVIFLYALNFALVPVLLVFIFRKMEVSALIPALFSAFFVIQEAFFHAVSESVILSIYCWAFWALLWKWNTGKFSFTLKWFAFIGITALCLFIHPTAKVLLGLILIYAGIARFQKRKDFFLSLGMLIVFCLAHTRYFSSDYDQAFLAKIKSIPDVLQHLSQNGTWSYIQRIGYIVFWPFAVIFPLSAGLLIWKRKIAEALWMCMATIGYIVLCLVMFPQGDAPFWMESRLVLLFPLLGFPFFTLLPKKWIYGISSVLLITGFWNIHQTAQDVYRPRFKYIKTVLDKMEQQHLEKAVLPMQPVAVEKLYIVWGTSMESFMISKLYNYKTARTFYVSDQPVDSLDASQICRSVLFVPWRLYYPDSLLRPVYYAVSDTSCYTTVDMNR